MSTHPNYYTELLRRRVTNDPVLTPAEQKELDLHVLICVQCSYEYAEALQTQAPEAAEALRCDLESRLSVYLVTPYLRDLAHALQAGQPLSDLQRMLWQFIQRDREAWGCFRLLQADAGLRDAGSLPRPNS
jgi:hypothetical protein